MLDELKRCSVIVGGYSDGADAGGVLFLPPAPRAKETGFESNFGCTLGLEIDLVSRW